VFGGVRGRGERDDGMVVGPPRRSGRGTGSVAVVLVVGMRGSGPCAFVVWLGVVVSGGWTDARCELGGR